MFDNDGLYPKIKTGALRLEVNDRLSVNTTFQGLGTTLMLIGYSTGST